MARLKVVDYEQALPVGTKAVMSVTDGDIHYTFPVDKITLIECNNSMCRIHLEGNAKVDLREAEVVKAFKQKLASWTVQV